MAVRFGRWTELREQGGIQIRNQPCMPVESTTTCSRQEVRFPGQQVGIVDLEEQSAGHMIVELTHG